MSRAEADAAVQSDLSRRVRGAIRELLSSKHLYQTVRVDDSDYPPSNLVAKAPAEVQPLAAMDGQAMLFNSWYPYDPANQRPSFGQPEPERPTLYFTPPDVKLFCETCQRIEPFNVVSAQDFLGRYSAGPFGEGTGMIQSFVFSYQCQGCKGIPETVMIRREGLKLIASGRSPMEHVAVPAVIPASIRRFFSGAVLAYQSGQTLAGNFLLRTTIEQWVRSFPPSASLPADKALDWYMATLPEDFADRFPSMRALYGRLSEDLHRATGSSEVFNQAVSEVVEHFEARRLFKL